MNEVVDVGGERAGEGEERRAAERRVESVAAGVGDGLGWFVVGEMGGVGMDQDGGRDGGRGDEKDRDKGDEENSGAAA